MMQMFPTVIPYFAGWCLIFCHPAKFHSPGGKKESKSNQATQSVQASLVWKLSCLKELSQEKNGIKEGWETHYGPGNPCYAMPCLAPSYGVVSGICLPFLSQLWSCIRNLPPLPTRPPGDTESLAWLLLSIIKYQSNLTITKLQRTLPLL